MKLRCPRCERKLNVPDKYAGKGIRCPACNRAFTVPAPQAAVGGTIGHSELDLEGLAGLESQSTRMDAEELQQHEQSEAGKVEKEVPESGYRLCPSCSKKTKVKDPYVEVLCSHCWSAIPALVRGGGLGGAKIARPKGVTATGAGGFYTELASAITYPIQAFAAILTATGFAVLGALLPVIIVTGLANLMQQGNVGTEQGVQKADLSGVTLMLIGIFALEIFFFSAVAMHAFFDVVRTTSIGSDKAPNLSFAPNNWGKSFMAYVVLAAYLGVLILIVGYFTVNITFANIEDAIRSGDISKLDIFQKPFLVGLVIIAFPAPMNLLGLSLGNISQALNPTKVVKSIIRTHFHYLFLVVVLVVYGGMFGKAFWSILFEWFVPKVNAMVASSKEGGLGQVALSLLAWGVVMLFFFYGTYVMGRLFGLFARTFRKDLLFGTA